MSTAAAAALSYAVSSLAIVFANKFVMQVVRDPFALLLGQVLVTLAFSSTISYFRQSSGRKFYLESRHVLPFAILGFMSFVGWAATLEGLKSGSVATLTLIKGVNPLVAAILSKFFLPRSESSHVNRSLGWVVLAGVGCFFYAFDRATADFRAGVFFFISVLAASVNAIVVKRIQLYAPLPDGEFSSVLYSSTFINAAVLPFVFFAFLETVSAEVGIQFVTLLSSTLAISALVLSLGSSIAISLSGFWTQQHLSAPTYIVFINSCKIPAILFSMLTGQDGCVSCEPARVCGILLWTLGSCRFLYLSMKANDISNIQQLPTPLGHTNVASTFLSRFRTSTFLLFAVSVTFVLFTTHTLFQFQISDIITSRKMLPSTDASSLMRLYASAAGPDPRILSGLSIGRHSNQRTSCSAIQFDESDVTHSLFDSAVKFSPGFEFVLGVPNATLKSWRDCSVEALRRAREYYAKSGGGVLPENISSHVADICPTLHMAVAPVILATIQSMTKLSLFFGFNPKIKEKHCFEGPRPEVTPSDKLKEWRTFIKHRVDIRKGAPAKFVSQKRGYVFAGSSRKHLLMARSIVDVLRAYGSVLPAEFWIDRADVDSPQASQDECHSALTRTGLRCRFMCEISEVQLYFPLCHPQSGSPPYQSKLIAMKYSSFEHVFFLDNDVVPLKSLDFMFSSPEFIHRGAIFWADALPTQPAFPFGPDVAAAIGMHHSSPVPDQYKSYLSPLCSAQIMVDKSRFWRELSLATYMNFDTTFYYRVMHGDKDIFAAAWLVRTNYDDFHAFHLMATYKSIMNIEHMPQTTYNSCGKRGASLTLTQALGSRWYLIQASGVIGYSCKMRDDGKCVPSLKYPMPGARVCGTEWLRYDTEGQPLLVHHTKDISFMTEFENAKILTSWQLLVEHTNTIDPVGAGISGGGYDESFDVADTTKHRSISSGGRCLELKAKNTFVKSAPQAIGNTQWLFYEIVNRNFGQPVNMPLDSFSCPNAPDDAGLVLVDKQRLRSDISDQDVRPIFRGQRTHCLCLFNVGYMGDSKKLCLDHPMRRGCIVYDIGVQNERKFASSMRRLGCEVHSYDPTMIGVTKEDWSQGTGGGVFHDVGVSHFNGEVEGIGKVQTVASMMRENGHSVIDYLKIDVESFEWDTLFEMQASGILENIGAIQMETHFWNKACFTHWVEWENMWRPLGYPKESFGTRACENKNAKGSAANNEDIIKWQKALDFLQSSGFQEIFLEVGGGGQMVEFPNGEVLPCCYEVYLTRPSWNGNAADAAHR